MSTALARIGSKLDLAARALAAGAEDRGFPGISQYQWGFPWQSDQNLLEYPKAAAKVATVYACVTRIAQDIASLPVKFYRQQGDKYVPLPDTHELPALWERGNPENSGYDVLLDWQANCDTTGESYLFLERGPNVKRKPFEIWSVPGHLLHPIPGPHRRVVEYQYRYGGATGSGEIFPAESFIPLRHWNPSWSPLEPSPRGMSPLSAAQLEYETIYMQSQWGRKFFESGGDVNLWLQTMDKERTLTEPEIKAVREAVERHAAGIKNLGRPKVLNGLNVVRPGMTMQEMQFVDMSKKADLAVCRVFHVPPLLLGVKDGGGMSDAGATTDLLLYAMFCLAPRAIKISKMLSARLCPIYGPDISCELDISGLLPIQNARLDQAKALQLLAGRAVMEVDEARDSLDMDPAANGEGKGLVAPFNTVFVKDLASTIRIQPGAPGDQAPVPDSAPAPAVKPEAAKNARLAAGSDPKAQLRRWKDSDLGRYERRVAVWARSRFSRQEDAVVARLGQGVRASRLLRAAYSADDLLPAEDDQAEAQRMFEALIAERGEAAAAEVGAEVALDVHGGHLRSLIGNRAGRMITQIDDTTRTELADLLRDLPVDGSFEDLVRAVRQVFDDRRANAATIARTETAWAYNLASKTAWTEAGVQYKSWLTVGDDHVRDAHTDNEAAGVLAMDELFPSGLAFPGDPMGDPGDTINCRCILQPENVGETDLARMFKRNGHGKPLAELFR